MNAPLKRLPPVVAFIVICCLAAAFVWLGLRLFFNESRLTAHLSQTFHGEQWQVLSGQAHKNSDAGLSVDSTAPQGSSLIHLSSLHIDSRFYQSLTLTFSQKHPSQPLLLRVLFQGGQTPEELPILYTNHQTSRFDMAAVAPDGGVISALRLQTNALIEPYQLATVQFAPKPLNTATFTQLLWQDLTQKTTAEAVSGRPSLMSPTTLLFIYFTVVGGLFALYLGLAGRSLVGAWWVSLIAAWAAIDLPYVARHTTEVIAAYRQFELSHTPLIVVEQGALLALSVLLSAWVLGFAVVRACVKQRYGFTLFAVGAGYVLGLLIMLVLTEAYALWQRPVVALEWLAGLWLFIVPILVFLRAKPCSIEELRLEKAASNRTYLMVTALVLLLIYRWGLDGFELLLQSRASVEPQRLTQVLTALWGSETTTTNALIYALPWWLANIAMCCLVVGGLRYLTAKLLPAMLSAYVVFSLLVLALSSAAANHESLWLAMLSLVFVMMFVAVLTYKEWRLLFCVILFVGLWLVTKNHFVLLAVLLPALLLGRLLGGVMTALLLLIGGGAILLFADAPALLPLLAAWGVSVNPEQIMQLPLAWLHHGYWQYMLLAAAGSVLLLLLLARNRDRLGLELLLVAGIAGLLFALLRLTIAPALAAPPVVLMVAPLAMLMPVCVYHLITKDDETLPLI